MGSRFSTVTQYHQIVLAHGIMAAFIFLLFVPFSVFCMRFDHGRSGFGRRWHARANVFAGLMLLATFILGYFAVGPERSLSNPHHGLGVAIFLLFILQLVGGSLVRNIKKMRSFRITLHQWSGRAIAILGIVQIPLGLTLYGSPLYTFILYALWMAFLVLLYFILDYKRQGRHPDAYYGGGRSEYTETDVTHDDGGGHSKKKWIAPLLAGAGVLAFMFRKKHKDKGGSRSRSRSRSHSRSRSYSRSRVDAMSAAPTSYFDSEKYDDDESDRRRGGGWMSKLAPLGAAFGAWKLATRGKNKDRDEEYSAVSTDTPNRPPRRAHTVSDLSEISDQYRRDPRGPPRMADPSMMSAADSRPPRRPYAPRRAQSDMYSGLSYDDGSYDSPSRRPTDKKGGMAKGLLAGMGMGWLANKFGKKKAPPRDDRSAYTYDDDSRYDDSRVDGSRFTEDTSYMSPPPRNSRAPPRRMSRGGRRGSLTEDSSVVEPRHGGGPGPPMPPLSHLASAPPVPPGYGSSRRDVDPVDMPPMPPDPDDPGLGRRESSRRRRDGADAAAAAAASASALAAEQEDEKRRRGDRRGRRERERGRESDRDTTPSRPPRTTIKMTMHDDRVNLRRLTDEEASKGRRRRAGSVSSLSEDTPSRRYRRNSSQRRGESRGESAAEQIVDPPDSPLSPPHPAFASGSRRAKDSAYYSGQGQGQPLVTPSHQSHGVPPVSTVDSGSHGTWSEAMSPEPHDRHAGSAAENRRRRRLERRRSVSSRPVGTDMFD